MMWRKSVILSKKRARWRHNVKTEMSTTQAHKHVHMFYPPLRYDDIYKNMYYIRTQ